MGRAVGLAVSVTRGSFVFAVKVITTTGVAVLVGVRVGVRVGVKVAEGMLEAVGVGAVEVGKGPKSAWEVSTMAVRVPLACLCASPASGGMLDSSV